jgi:hypothetical protein
VQVAGRSKEAHQQLLLTTMHQSTAKKALEQRIRLLQSANKSKDGKEVSFWDKMLTITAQS